MLKYYSTYEKTKLDIPFLIIFHISLNPQTLEVLKVIDFIKCDLWDQIFFFQSDDFTKYYIYFCV